MKKILVVGVILLFLGSSISVLGQPKEHARPLSHTLYVGGSGPGNYSTITQALANASDGDNIFVYHGLYNERLSIEKAVRLLGENPSNTTIHGTGSGYYSNIISLDVSNCEVSGFTITGTLDGGKQLCGISVWNQAFISNNTIFNCTYAIAAGSDVLIWKNTITNNGLGIESVGKNVTISQNIFGNNNGVGVLISNAAFNTVTNNTFKSGDGIRIETSYNTTIGWCTHYIDNNLANDRPIYYYSNQTGIDVPGNAEEVILAGCSNCTVHDLNISNIGDGILIGGYSNYNRIFNNIIINCDHGLSSQCGIHDKIYGNTILDNRVGISLPGVSNTYESHLFYEEIYGNYLKNNKVGIFASSGVVMDKLSLNIERKNSDSVGGICIHPDSFMEIPLKNSDSNSSSFYPGYYSTCYSIHNNTITSTKPNSAYYGLFLENANYNNVFGNNVTNYQRGIWVFGAYGSGCANTIYRNNISNNQEGLNISGGADGGASNKIYENNFIKNDRNAIDEIGWTPEPFLQHNLWYNVKTRSGNYWDDYTGVDYLPPYGIGDTPYQVAHSKYSQDRFPLMNPYGSQSLKLQVLNSRSKLLASTVINLASVYIPADSFYKKAN